ncbi:hypothetical protein GY14_27245 [Delftia tsuruhatensis]|nr:hypothetical protein GY14_27245 [Delftia tsuruhatensis]
MAAGKGIVLTGWRGTQTDSPAAEHRRSQPEARASGANAEASATHSHRPSAQRAQAAKVEGRRSGMAPF